MSTVGFNDIKYKASSGQVNLDEAQGMVECFVAGIGNKDSVGDVCASGAFTKSLLRRKPRVVWGHNWNDPIGKVLEIYEVPPSDPRLPQKMRAAGIGGLYARVQFNLNSEKGREAFANVAFFGEEQEWSIGYKTLRAQFDQSSQANILYEVELYEVSPVLHGANQLTGTISVKADENNPMMMGPNAPIPTMGSSLDEDPEMMKKLERELAARLGIGVKVRNMNNGIVEFSREDQPESGYKCRFHHDGGVFMFGRPERLMPNLPARIPPRQISPESIQETKPTQQTAPGMPSRPMSPSIPGQMIVVPSALPGANPMAPPLVRVDYTESPKQTEKPELVKEERDLAEAILRVVDRHGKFNEDGTGVWVGYESAAENEVAKIGVTCANCVLYEGEGKCKIIAMKVEPQGKCRFAIIPDNVVSLGPISRMKRDDYTTEKEVEWLEDIEAKYPGEFVSGRLRKIIRKRYKKRSSQKSIAPLSSYEEKSLEDFIDLDDVGIDYYIPVSVDDAFEVKQALDPIMDYYMVDSYVEDGGIIITNGVTKDFVDAIGAALKGFYNHPFGRSEKAAGQGLGQRIGVAGNLAGRTSRAAAVFNPNAWDGDNDGLVQEGTPFQRPAIPGVNDFGTRGRVNPERALEAFINGQGGEVSATGQVLPPRRVLGAATQSPQKPKPESSNLSSGRKKPVADDLPEVRDLSEGETREAYDSYYGDTDTPPMSDDEMQAEADWAEANGLASGGGKSIILKSNVRESSEEEEAASILSSGENGRQEKVSTNVVEQKIVDEDDPKFINSDGDFDVDAYENAQNKNKEKIRKSFYNFQKEADDSYKRLSKEKYPNGKVPQRFAEAKIQMDKVFGDSDFSGEPEPIDRSLVVARDANNNIVGAARFRKGGTRGDDNLFIHHMASYGKESEINNIGSSIFRDILKIANDDNTGITLESTPGSKEYWESMGFEDVDPEKLIFTENAYLSIPSEKVRKLYNDVDSISDSRQTLSSGRAPRYPRQPTLGAFLGKAEEIFDGVDSWEEFRDRYNDTEMVFLDYETTGLNFDEFGKATANGSPTQIGLVRVKNGKEMGRLNLFMNPEEPLGEWSLKNLKDADGKPISNEWLATQMPMSEAHKQVAEFIGPDAIIGVQNATFDKNVLDDALAKSGIDWRPSGYLDTRDISAMTLPVWSEENQDAPYALDRDGNKQPSSSLASITEYLGVELGEGHHNADADAFATSQVMQKIIDGAIENGWSTDVLDKEKRDAKLKAENDKFEADIKKFESAKSAFIAEKDKGLSSGGGRAKAPSKNFMTDEEIWREGMLGASLDDLAERTGMTRAEVRKAQLEHIKENRGKPEFDVEQDDLVIHREYMAQMEKLGIYPPGNPDYYSGSDEQKLSRATEAASSVGLSVEEASSGGNPEYWDFMTSSKKKPGLSSGSKGETPTQKEDRQIYERRIATKETVDEVAESIGIDRAAVRQAEMRHAKKLRDESLASSLKDETPQQKRDREIFDKRSTTGMSLDEVAEEMGISRADARQAEARHASRLRNEPLSQRDERKNRLSSGRVASDGGNIKPKANAESVKKKASRDRQKLSSGDSLGWSNPSDGLPSNMDNWTENDWETYGARSYIQRERRGVRPFGKELSNGLREELSNSLARPEDGSLRYGGHTSDMGYASVEKGKDGTWTATRWTFDDYEGYHVDDFDYDTSYERGGFDTPEEASDWLANKIEKENAYIYGDKKRDKIATLLSKDTDESNVSDGSFSAESMDSAWAEYYRKQDEYRLLGESESGPNDVVRIQPGLSSGKAPYQMGGRISSQIYKKMPPRTEYDYSPDGDRIPTEEQKTVIDAVMTGENVLVPALAGTGKTSTLVSLAKRMKKEQPDKNLLYLAFNASAARDAKKRFRGLNNVEIVTLDAIGKRWIEDTRGKVGKRFSSRIDVIYSNGKKDEELVPLTPRAIAKQLGLKTQVIDGKEMSGDEIAKLAISAVKKFEISSDGQIGLQHFVDNKGNVISPDILPGNILDIANMHWKDKTADDGKSVIQFNTLTKMWALSEPDFSEKGWGSNGAKDLVLYDEAQDLNPVWNAAAAKQTVQNIFVGDPNQAIYGFRGASNELDSIAERSDYVLPITEVFRFGPEIAGYTNRALAILGIENNRMVGRGKPGEVVEPGTMTDATMVINRTNGGVIRSALDEINNNRTVATTPNAKKEVDRTINSIRKLKFNVPSRDLHPDLEEFENWKELEDAVSNGTATGKQESLFRLMSNITLADFKKVQDSLQIWDPDAGEDTGLPENLMDGANFTNGLGYAADNGVIYLTGKTFDNKTAIGATKAFTYNKVTKRWELNKTSDDKAREVLTGISAISSSGGRSDKSVPRLEMPDSIGVSGELGGGVKYEISGNSIALTGNTFNMGTILRANGFSFDKDAKQWVNKTSRSESERVGILDSVVLQSIKESDSARPANAKPDVVVTTAHQAKGLETERGKLGSDWWGPKVDKATGETVWPDEEHIHALYVALSRSMKVLDPGSASWITDWTDDEDELPNTQMGLSSGRARKTTGKIAKRRPFSEEERQAFADGQRQRAQTIPGKKKPGPSAGEFGTGGTRRTTGINRSGGSGSTGLSSGRVQAGENLSAAEAIERSTIASAFGAINVSDEQGDESSPVGRRRSSRPQGIGMISGSTEPKKPKSAFIKGKMNKSFRDRLQKISGKKWNPKLGNLSSNEQPDGRTPWMLDANKLFELFRGDDGKIPSDERIISLLRIGGREGDKQRLTNLDGWRRPGAGVPEFKVAEFIEALDPDSPGAGYVGSSIASKIWGFDSAPEWTDSKGKKITREEYENMRPSERNKLVASLGEFEDYEIEGESTSDDAELPAPKRPDAKTGRRPGEGGGQFLSLEQAVSREAPNGGPNYSAEILARKLGFIKDKETLRGEEALARFIKNLESLNIFVARRTAQDYISKGMTSEVLGFLVETGAIPSVSDVYGEQFSSFDEIPSKNSIKRRVYDLLKDSGMSDSETSAAMDKVFASGKIVETLLKQEEKRKRQVNGEIPFAPSGANKDTLKELDEYAELINKVLGKKGDEKLSTEELFNLKNKISSSTGGGQAPEAVQQKPKPEVVEKPIGRLLKQYPEPTRWEDLNRESVKALSDDEIKKALYILEELSDPRVEKNDKTGVLSFPDGLKPSDERVKKAKIMLKLVEAEADFREKAPGKANESKIRDAIEEQYGWRLPSEGLPQNMSDWTMADRATFRERIEIEERMGIKSAWSGASIRTKGDKAQRYRIT